MCKFFKNFTFESLSSLINFVTGINYFRGRVSQQLFGHGTGPIVLSYLNCNGNERDLFQCQNSGYNFGAAHMNNDVGVRCQQKFDRK